jgi:RNA polymerase sigma factor (sigma-70 family)
MAGLTETEVTRAVSCLPELYALTPIEDFPARVLMIVHRLIGCDQACYNDIDLGSGEYRVLVDPEDGGRSAMAPAFGAYVHQHPVIAHIAATGDSSSHLISDFIRPVEFRRLGLYGEFFRPLGLESQLSISLSPPPTTSLIGLSLDRSRPDFSDHDRMLLDLLRPHLVAAHQNSLRYTDALIVIEESPVVTSALNRLTDRQHQIVRLVSEGLTNAQIASALGISAATVKKHLEHVYERLQVNTRTAAASYYLRGTRKPVESHPWAATVEGRASSTLSL